MNRIVQATAMALALLALTGCVTPINWQARVGVYTYNQAVMDYGPPMSVTRLNDSSTVVEWMTDRGQVVVSPGPYYYGPNYYGPGYYSGYPGRYYYGPAWPAYSTTYFPARYLRLEFGPDGKLKAWKEFTK
jgi:hypothetical protein